MSRPNKNSRYTCHSLLFLIFSLLMFTALYGCGTGPDSSSPTPTPSSSGTLTVSVSSSTVTFGTPITVTATLTNSGGAVIPNTVVTFAATSTLVAFTPASATALTNASGVASLILNAASIDSDGAASITASAPITTSGTTTTVTSTPVGISVGGATVTLGELTFSPSSISAYGTATASIPVLIGGLPATVPISVTFTSTCVASGKATISPLVAQTNTTTGIATSTYTDKSCNSGTDTITASVTGGATKSATITVVPPTVNNIQFISATPAIIATQTVGAATLPKSSIVKFQVVDTNGNGVKGVIVDFTLIASIQLGGLTYTPTSATSDADGYVSTSVTSGTVPTPVWVVATVRGSSISCKSGDLKITTGLPAQNNFSLSIGTFNIEGLSYDGVTSSLTIIASDRLGNPVPDGTAINFITPEGGQINPASCTTSSGTCTTTFMSANPRPPNGRVTILAYAAGEKTFVDANGNNIYDTGETFYDLGDLYVDVNENSKWDAGEQFFLPSSGYIFACKTQPAGTSLPYGWDVRSKEYTCSTRCDNDAGINYGISYVRRGAVITFSGSDAFMTTPWVLNMGSLCTASISPMLYDINNNPMPAGTTITTANNNVYYTAAGFLPAQATVSISSGTPVGNSTAVGGTSITIKVAGGSTCSGNTVLQYPQGSVDIVVTTPKGNTTIFPFTVTGATLTPNITVAAAITSVKAGEYTTLTATVTDQFGAAIPGIPVDFAFVSNKSGATLSKPQVPTNTNGQAIIYYTAGTTSGVNDTIVASLINGSYSSTVVIGVTP